MVYYAISESPGPYPSYLIMIDGCPMGLNGEQHYGVSLVGIHAGEKGHHTPDTRMVSHSLSIIGRLLIVYWPPWSFLFAHIAKVIRRTQATQAIQMSLLTCLIWTTLRLDPPRWVLR